MQFVCFWNWTFSPWGSSSATEDPQAGLKHLIIKKRTVSLGAHKTKDELSQR